MQNKKIDVTQCKKCLYRPPRSPEYDAIGCFYILYMGKPRPCEPSPNCTVFKPYSEKERKEMGKKICKQF